MTPSVKFEIGDRATEAIHRLVASRENQDGLAGAINMAMQYWVSFIMAKQTVAPKGGIKDYMLARSDRTAGGAPSKLYRKSGRESSAAKYLQLRKSRAAAIVYASDYQNARKVPTDEFYSIVSQYVARRQYSAGHHKAGFRPALDAFKIARGKLGSAPEYERHAPGEAKTAHPIAEAVIQATVKNKAGGAARNPGGGMAAVLQSEGEVVAMLERFTAQNLLERARRAGLRVRI